MAEKAELWCVRTGTLPYADGVALQEDVAAARRAGDIPDTLLLVEHHPVFTKGRRAEAAELAMGEDWYRRQGIEVRETKRGGRVTYHGPGQAVAYPMVDLAELGEDGRPDVIAFVRSLEQAMIATLGEYGIEARVIEGLTGVWTAGPSPEEDPGPQAARKIGSIGIHVSRGVTTHGLAINVNNDLQPFEWIVPCGIEAVRMTSVSRELGEEQDLDRFFSVLAERCAGALGRARVDVPPERLRPPVLGPDMGSTHSVPPPPAHAGARGTSAPVPDDPHPVR